jgi:hypothetical protein
MAQTRDAKRVVVERQHPLYHSGAVELICAFVGPGHWAFKAPISKLWLQSYRKVPVKNQTLFIQDRKTIQITHFESAFASQDTLKYALAYGLKWQQPEHQMYGMYTAIGKCADKEVLTAAFKMGMPKHTRLNDGAAEAGDLAKLKFLCKKMKCPLNKSEIMASAAEGSSIPLLQFLAKEGCSFDDDDIFAYAAKSGLIPVLKYLLEQEECVIGTRWLSEAAYEGHLHVLQWAADNVIHDSNDDDSDNDSDNAFEPVIEWNDCDLCSSAAQSGSIEMMQFLQQKGANLVEHNVTNEGPWTVERITTIPARSERKEMLLWLKQQGILPTVHAMLDVAELDMLDMCLFLHTECNCPWDATVLTRAAHNGYFELVQALYERVAVL